MYAVVSKFKIKPGREDEAKATASDILEHLKGVKGLKYAVICSDEETREFARVTVWETKEDQVAYEAAGSPERREAAMELVEGTGERKGYDVVGYVTAD